MPVDVCGLSCLSCEDSTCNECPILSAAEDGECEVNGLVSTIGGAVVKLLSIVRHYKLKSVLLFSSDLWLYQYHKHNYTGTLHAVFEAARLIESEKNRIVPTDRIEFISQAEEHAGKYRIDAN